MFVKINTYIVDMLNRWCVKLDLDIVIRSVYKLLFLNNELFSISKDNKRNKESFFILSLGVLCIQYVYY